MSRLMDNFDWCAAAFRQGATCEQIVKRYPQFDSGTPGTVLMNEEPTPSNASTNAWLMTLRHHWVPNGGTQIGSESCTKCGAWTMTNKPAFGCEGSNYD